MCYCVYDLIYRCLSNCYYFFICKKNDNNINIHNNLGDDAPYEIYNIYHGDKVTI